MEQWKSDVKANALYSFSWSLSREKRLTFMTVLFWNEVGRNFFEITEVSITTRFVLLLKS